MTITWQPWKKIILEPGDNHAAHSASKGGLRLDLVEITQENENSVQIGAESKSLADDAYLEPWQRWLDKGELDNLWDSED
jgi:hypothetical protein